MSVHMVVHFNIAAPVVVDALNLVPGVPVFFFVSGYLVWLSFERINDRNESLLRKILRFFSYRALRIYPALSLCFAVTLSSLFLLGYMETQRYSQIDIAAWAIATLTIFQFFSPGFLQSYGVGAINGSLWTIGVELQFYALLPLLFLFAGKSTRSMRLLVFVFMLINTWHCLFNTRETLALQIIGLSFLPWFGIFLLGAYCARNQKISEIASALSLATCASVYAIAVIASLLMDFRLGNEMGLFGYGALALLVLKLAHWQDGKAASFLKGNDFSYGIYIYHMPIINGLLFLGVDDIEGAATSVVLTAVAAVISWHFVEKPALRLKLK